MYSAVSFSAAPPKPKATKESPVSVEMKPADTKPSDVKPEEPKPAEETPKKIKRIDSYIAVFDLETTGKVDKDVIRPLTESIRREIVKSGKYEVIDRGNMDKILGEQKFQLSGCVSGQCIVEVGQLLGVGKIITGSVSMVGKTYYFSLQLVNVETGKIEDQSEDECKCEIDDLIKSSKRLVKRLLGEQVATPESVTTIKPAETKEASEQKPVIASETKQSQAYLTAYNAFKEKRYKEAREKFELFLREFPKDSLADDAQFWIAETYYAEEDYAGAIVEFEALLRNYPDSEKLPAALFKQGYAFFKMGDKKAAKAILEQVEQKYPKSKEAELARKEIEKIKNR